MVYTMVYTIWYIPYGMYQLPHGIYHPKVVYTMRQPSRWMSLIRELPTVVWAVRQMGQREVSMCRAGQGVRHAE